MTFHNCSTPVSIQVQTIKKAERAAIAFGKEEGCRSVMADITGDSFLLCVNFWAGTVVAHFQALSIVSLQSD
jgi:hypothetical protein